MAKPVRHGDKWRIRWTDARGRRQSAVFDEFRTAQVELARHHAETADIQRGRLALVDPDKTCNDLFDYWLEKRAVQKRSEKDDASIIRAHLRPFFGAMRVMDVGTEDGDDYINEKDELSPKTIANHLTLLKTMLNAAASFKVAWLSRVPKLRKPQVSLFSRDYQYLRTDEEIERFLRTARAEGEHVFVLYATAVYTGMRAGELAALEWSDIDFERRLITVQRSFDGPTKSDKVRYVPILTPLLTVLKEWRLRHPGHLVFTNRDARMHRESGRIFQEILHRVLDAAGFAKVVRGKKERPYVRFHDLRHTFASHWVAKGGDLFKLQKILGHQSVVMTQRYAHLAPEAFQTDYDRLGREAPATPGQVVPFPGVSSPG